MQLNIPEYLIKANKRIEKIITLNHQRSIIDSKNIHLWDIYLDQIEMGSIYVSEYIDDEYEANCIMVMLMEILIVYKYWKREESLHKNIKPKVTSGSMNLLKALDAFKLHPYNIEEIIIKTRNKKDYYNLKADKAFEEKKSYGGEKIKITGSEPIKILMQNTLNIKSIAALYELTKSEEQLKKYTLFKGKGNVNTNFFKIGAKILDKYLSRYIKEFKSARERYYLGVKLLELIDIKPDYKKAEVLMKDEKAMKNAMINNFKAAVNSKK